MKIRIGPYPKADKERKVSIRIDKYDTWSMDHTLALIILPMLKQLKETKQGSPGSMLAFQQTSNQDQLTFDFYGKEDDAAWEAGHKEWDQIMTKMIWSFQQIVDNNWEEQYCKKSPEFDEDFNLIKRGEYDWDGMNKHEEKIKEGCELFGKYFRNLWD